MTWVRIDDNFLDHPKVAGLSAEAFRLHVRGLCYCSRYLTDGRVPEAIVAEWVAAIRRRTRHELSPIRTLTDAGLWVRKKHQFVIHDYLDYNPSRAKVTGQRAADRERKASVRSDSGWNPDGVRSDSDRPDPARPQDQKIRARARKPKAKPRLTEGDVPSSIAGYLGRVIREP